MTARSTLVVAAAVALLCVSGCEVEQGGLANGVEKGAAKADADARADDDPGEMSAEETDSGVRGSPNAAGTDASTQGARLDASAEAGLRPGTSPQGPSASPQDGGSSADTGTGAPSDAAAPAPSVDAGTCSGSQRVCDSMCVDTASDERHCGACNAPCAMGQVCEASTCKTQPGLGTRVPVTTCAIGEQPPKLVSETGCYADLASRRPAQGLIPYSVVSNLWADGTAKRRFLALPGTTTIGFRSEGAWELPLGTVLIKEFLLETRRGDPTSLRPLETRFLVRRQDRWDGYTYRWNDASTNAELYDGGSVTYAVTDSAGMASTYTHWFPGKNDCRRCHNDSAGGALGLRTLQMNRVFDYGGVVDNQLRAFGHIGLFGSTLPADLSGLPSMPTPLDNAAPLAARARSYLEGNCAHCHHPGGPANKALDLRYQTPFAATHTCNEKPEAGDLGVKEAKIIVPGRHDLSVLWLRISRRDNQQMPQIGSLLVDPDASALLRDWINGLTGCH